MIRKGWLPLLLLASSLAYGQQSPYKPPVFTDPARNKKIEAAFPVVEKIYRDYAIKNHYPGLAFGIIADGKLVYSGSVGYTDLSRQTPVHTNSLFRIASMTKSFTALAILKLRDEGRLNLEDPVYM